MNDLLIWALVFSSGVIAAPLIYFVALTALVCWRMRRALSTAERIAVAIEDQRLREETAKGEQVLRRDIAAGKDCRRPKERKIA